LEKARKAGIAVPVHQIDTERYPNDLELRYYHFDSSEVVLVTYFLTKDAHDEVTRVARLRTCRYCAPIGLSDENLGRVPDAVTWAKEFTGRCSADSLTYADRFDGDPFQSCVWWYDDGGTIYKLYTVWEEEEAVKLANALVVADQEPLP
jgi:hypothetical protein